MEELVGLNVCLRAVVIVPNELHSAPNELHRTTENDGPRHRAAKPQPKSGLKSRVGFKPTSNRILATGLENEFQRQLD
jgi:hypothetical protein